MLLRQVTKVIKREVMDVYCNIEMHLGNHCCCGSVISVTYSQHVFIALIIEHAKDKHCIAIRCLSSSTIFFHIIS
jgi:hypothetical protein